MSENNNISFRQNVLDTVVKTLHFEEPRTKSFQPITETTRLDEDLDLQCWGVCFFINTLEEVTLLDLDITLNDLNTIGDVCDLVENRFKSADKRLLMHKVFATKILPYLNTAPSIIQTKNITTVRQEQPKQIKDEKMIKLLEGYNHPITPESVFYNVKQILLVQNHAKAVDLTMDLLMVKDLKMFGKKLTNLITELESRYNLPIVSQAKIQRAKNLQEFCTICAADFNKGRLAVIQGQAMTQNKR